MTDISIGTFQRACAVDEVGPESALAVEVGGTDLAIVHSGASFFAVADECSHAAIPLSEGDVGDCEIECYLHGSRFDLRTGEALARHRARGGLPGGDPRRRGLRRSRPSDHPVIVTVRTS